MLELTLAENPQGCVYHIECLFFPGKPQAFLGAETQVAAQIEAFAEQSYYPALQGTVKIDQNIATQNDVHFAKHLVRSEIMVREDNVAFQALVHNHAVIASGEVVR